VVNAFCLETAVLQDRPEDTVTWQSLFVTREDNVHSSKLKARMIIVSLLAAFLAVMSTSMTASATSPNSEPAASTSVDGGNPDSEDVGQNSDSASCLPPGAGCSVRHDNCCGACVPIIGGGIGTCG
jgi:hypothetical protein